VETAVLDDEERGWLREWKATRARTE